MLSVILSLSVLILSIVVPTEILLPSGKHISVMIPLTGDGNSIVTLSVTISANDSYVFTLSPTDFIHLFIIASVIDSPTFGNFISMMFPYINKPLII